MRQRLLLVVAATAVVVASFGLLPAQDKPAPDAGRPAWEYRVVTVSGIKLPENATD